jgi:hypothetical protein
MGTRNIKIMFLGSKVRRVRRADNLTAIWADCLENVGSLTSHKPIGLHGVTGIALLFFFAFFYFTHLLLMVAPVLKQALRREDVWGSVRIDPHFLHLGTSWSWVVSFTPRPLYTREIAPSTYCECPWPRSRYGRRKGKILDPTGIRTPTDLPSRPLQVAIPTTGRSDTANCLISISWKLWSTEYSLALSGNRTLSVQSSIPPLYRLVYPGSPPLIQADLSRFSTSKQRKETLFGFIAVVAWLTSRRVYDTGYRKLGTLHGQGMIYIRPEVSVAGECLMKSKANPERHTAQEIAVLRLLLVDHVLKSTHSFNV